jgi:hypothetical protein
MRLQAEASWLLWLNPQDCHEWHRLQSECFSSESRLQAVFILGEAPPEGGTPNKCHWWRATTKSPLDVLRRKSFSRLRGQSYALRLALFAFSEAFYVRQTSVCRLLPEHEVGTTCVSGVDQTLNSGRLFAPPANAGGTDSIAK